MILSLKKDKNTTVVGLIASAVRRDIAFGQLEPDKKLKIEELRSKYGGSSHSMREALTLLHSEGLVEANSQKGFRVSSATEEDLKDINRMRCEIEKLGLEWSMQNSSVSWEGQVIAAQHAFSRAQDAVEVSLEESALMWDEANKSFHLSLIAACESPRLMITASQLYDQSRRFRLAALREGQINFQFVSKNNEELVQAILTQNLDTALACLQKDIEANL